MVLNTSLSISVLLSEVLNVVLSVLVALSMVLSTSVLLNLPSDLILTSRKQTKKKKEILTVIFTSYSAEGVSQHDVFCL